MGELWVWKDVHGDRGATGEVKGAAGGSPEWHTTGLGQCEGREGVRSEKVGDGGEGGGAEEDGGGTGIGNERAEGGREGGEERRRGGKECARVPLMLPRAV